MFSEPAILCLPHRVGYSSTKLLCWSVIWGESREENCSLAEKLLGCSISFLWYLMHVFFVVFFKGDILLVTAGKTQVLLILLMIDLVHLSDPVSQNTGVWTLDRGSWCQESSVAPK